jgi:hypothetical protein
MSDDKNNKDDIPANQKELFRSMMVKEMLHKIEDKLKTNNGENVMNTLKQLSDDSQLIEALKKMKNKK